MLSFVGSLLLFSGEGRLGEKNVTGRGPYGFLSVPPLPLDENRRNIELLHKKKKVNERYEWINRISNSVPPSLHIGLLFSLPKRFKYYNKNEKYNKREQIAGIFIFISYNHSIMNNSPVQLHPQKPPRQVPKAVPSSGKSRRRASCPK